MGFGKRLKERRQILGLSRLDVSERLGITSSAIANYENSISFPKTDLLYGLFDILDCDANYLFQDVIHTDGKYTIEEWDIINKYRQLDQHGQELVRMVLEKELERVSPEAELSYDAAARSKDDGAKTLTLKKDFHPEEIENEVDF